MMEPLEQVTVLMTLMRRLGQVMEHERAILLSLRLDVLADIQEEKAALAEAYEIELSRLRCSPEILASLDTRVRDQLDEALRGFQACAAINLNALRGAKASVAKILHSIGDSLADGPLAPGDRRQPSMVEPRGQVISVVFDRKA
jgi:hypothetical protein